LEPRNKEGSKTQMLEEEEARSISKAPKGHPESRSRRQQREKKNGCKLGSISLLFEFLKYVLI
jgi:hypothetical protein